MSGLGFEMSERPGPRISMIADSSPASLFSSWLPSWRSKQEYSALPSTSKLSPPETSLNSKTSRRRIMQIAAVGLIILSVAGFLHVGTRSSVKTSLQTEGTAKQWEHSQGETPTSSDSMWGWHEDMGWEPSEDLGLADLGDIAEERYRLGFSKGKEGTEHYFKTLHQFASSLTSPHNLPILSSLHSHLPPSHSNLLPKPAAGFTLGPPSMISYKTIHQTDKSKNPITEETEEWVRMNEKDGWKLNFLNDETAYTWMKSRFENTDIDWAWSYMNRGVLRADLLRYLLPLIEGGVYSDVDTRPIRPIEQWGRINVEYLDISLTDGPDWRKSLATAPSVMVAIDVNVHNKTNWHLGWPRALGICQWTLSGAPNHPIYLDAARRVVNSTRVVESWDNERAKEIIRLETERPINWQSKATQLKAQTHEDVMEVMEWTGPGLFSDAVISFLLARYNVSWHRLRGLEHPLRIGDVMILPITAFSPGGEPDFRSEGPDSPQANVLHEFRGSWKPEGWRR